MIKERNNMKRILTVILILVLTLSAFCTAAFAYESEDGQISVEEANGGEGSDGSSDGDSPANGETIGLVQPTEENASVEKVDTGNGEAASPKIEDATDTDTGKDESVSPEIENSTDTGNGEAVSPEVEDATDTGKDESASPEIENATDTGNGEVASPEVEDATDTGKDEAASPEVEYEPDTESTAEETPKSGFDKAYDAIMENADKIFALFAFLSSLVVGFAYKKGLLPLVKNALSAVASGIASIKEASAKAGEESAAALDAARDKLAHAEETVKLIADRMEALEAELERANEGARKNGELRIILSSQIDLLYEIFMSSSLPTYQKDLIGERVAGMKRELEKESEQD